MAINEKPAAASNYRWVVLTVYFLLTVVIEIQWLTFAPAARQARLAYGATALQIDLLSIVFMACSLVICIPASYCIGRFGIRRGIGLGAVLTGGFALLKAMGGASYAVVFAAQLGLGLAQPFITNGATAVAAKWFLPNQRATAVGLATLAQFVGFIIANLATPRLIQPAGATYDLQPMLWIYDGVTVAATAAFLLLMREAPAALPGAPEVQAEPPAGLRNLLRNRDMLLSIVLFWIGLGMFNALTTSIDQLSEVKGFSSRQTGEIMGVLFAAGIVGALILPTWSDRARRRRPFIVAAIGLVAPAILGMALATDYYFMLASAALFGVFLLGAAGPIGFQYAAEVGRPAPESLSQGILLLAGQVSGILFVVGMNVAGMQNFMYAFVAMSVFNFILAWRLRESPIAARHLATA
jgi:MFS family permease